MGSDGNFVVPDNDYVKIGVEYGVDGISIVGNYNPSVIGDMGSNNCQYDVYSNPDEGQLIDCQAGDYISTYGHKCDLYIMTKFDPENVWGEDPLKKYEFPPVVIDCIWEPTSESQRMGAHGKISDEDEIILYAHITSVKNTIKSQLIDEGYIVDDDTYTLDEDRTKEERHRIEVQEGDIIRTRFNNIHYEVTGVKTAPDFQHLLYKYFYEIHAVPRLVSSEGLGYIQPVTEESEIREAHNQEIDAESSKILF